MKISNQRNVYNGHFKIELYDVTNPENGQTHTEECFERGDSVAALVFDREKQTFLFTEQFRIGSKSNLIEIVAGSMDKDGEQPIDALKRELMEETGHEATEWHFLGKTAVDANRGAGHAFLFLALNAHPVQSCLPGDLEEQRLLKLTRQELEHALDHGQFKVLAWAAVVAMGLRKWDSLHKGAGADKT